MTTLKPQRVPGETLATWAWAAVASTPVGWFFGALAVAYSHLGDMVDVNQEITGFLLFVAAPTSAFILAVYAARAGHRSGKIAVIVSGLLLLATIVLTLLYEAEAFLSSPSTRHSMPTRPAIRPVVALRYRMKGGHL